MPRAASRSSIFAEIWSTVRHIPRGKVASYGEIARLSGFIGQARRVGYALRSAPPGMRLPWHRVVNSQGRISLPKGDGSYQRQREDRFAKARLDPQVEIQTQADPLILSPPRATPRARTFPID
ncbi:MAG: hypothetical protein E6K56_10015 [Ignavibacteria bacterium]|nr:MAG: hypothetical protein E6K56_10015 [Ignavibacteria bacterium]